MDTRVRSSKRNSNSRDAIQALTQLSATYVLTIPWQRWQSRLDFCTSSYSLVKHNVTVCQPSTIGSRKHNKLIEQFVSPPVWAGEKKYLRCISTRTHKIYRKLKHPARLIARTGSQLKYLERTLLNVDDVPVSDFLSLILGRETCTLTALFHGVTNSSGHRVRGISENRSGTGEEQI